ncbi:hypothetical protein ACJJTC_009430 [Scirpophaga incertulas]
MKFVLATPVRGQHVPCNIGLQNTIDSLQEQLKQRAQVSLRNEVEIQGLSETPNENSVHVVVTLAQRIGLPLDVCDLEYASRVGKPQKRNKKLESTGISSPRPLRLTSENRRLFRIARDRCKSAEYKYCWIKNGSVYIRKTDGTIAYQIKNVNEQHRRVPCDGG